MKFVYTNVYTRLKVVKMGMVITLLILLLLGEVEVYDLNFVGDLYLPTHAVYVFKYCMFLIYHVLRGLSENKVTITQVVSFTFYSFMLLSISMKHFTHVHYSLNNFHGFRIFCDIDFALSCMDVLATKAQL